MNTVRGPIRHWIEKHAGQLGNDVLEVGSRIHAPGAWWVVNRDLATGEWTGIDMQAGEGVDVVCDMHKMPMDWAGRFTGVVLSEVLEHTRRPWKALPEVRRVMREGARLVVTVPFCFFEHAYPDDYYRYTPSGLRVLLEDAGFTCVETETFGEVPFIVSDHGDTTTRRTAYMHTMATALA